MKDIKEQLDGVAEAAKQVGRYEEECRWQVWRKDLLRCWANDYRATMTALLEDGPG